MDPLRRIGTELTYAALVLAMVFLSFAHAPLAQSADQRVLLNDGISTLVRADIHYCGQAPADDAAGHPSCHACRVGAGADLPSPPHIALPCRPASSVRYLHASAHWTAYRFIVPFGARAPPALI